MLTQLIYFCNDITLETGFEDTWTSKTLDTNTFGLTTEEFFKHYMEKYINDIQDSEYSPKL